MPARIPRNPFLVLLLKGLLRQEVEHLFYYGNDEQVANYLASQRTRDFSIKFDVELHLKSRAEGGRRPRSPDPQGTTSFMRRFWGIEDEMNFSTTYLDWCAGAIRLLGKFANWDDFVGQYKECQYAKEAEEFLGMSEIELADLRRLPEIRLNVADTVHDAYVLAKVSGKLGGVQYRNVKQFTKKLYLRSVDIVDFVYIEQLLRAEKNQEIVPERIRFITYETNSLFVLVDSNQNYFSHFCALPIKKDTFEKLKSGQQQEHQLSADDFETTASREIVYFGQWYFRPPATPVLVAVHLNTILKLCLGNQLVSDDIVLATAKTPYAELFRLAEVRAKSDENSFLYTPRFRDMKKLVDAFGLEHIV